MVDNRVADKRAYRARRYILTGDIMHIIFNGRSYRFRPCDVKGITQEELQRRANETGRLQHEPRSFSPWLVVPGVGYGWEEE